MPARTIHNPILLKRIEMCIVELGMSYEEVARRFRMAPGTISRISRERGWRAKVEPDARLRDLLDENKRWRDARLAEARAWRTRNAGVFV